MQRLRNGSGLRTILCAALTLSIQPIFRSGRYLAARRDPADHCAHYHAVPVGTSVHCCLLPIGCQIKGYDLLNSEMAQFWKVTGHYIPGAVSLREEVYSSGATYYSIKARWVVGLFYYTEVAGLMYI